jgi:hypothetical protein
MMPRSFAKGCFIAVPIGLALWALIILGIMKLLAYLLG